MDIKPCNILLKEEIINNLDDAIEIEFILNLLFKNLIIQKNIKRIYLIIKLNLK